MQVAALAPVSFGRPAWRRFRRSASVPALAAAVVGLGVIFGWRGVDLPAQLYRVASFRAHGLALWDPQWFGGQWTLSYSVLYPAVAGIAGVAVVTIAAAAGAALAFDRLAVDHLGAGGRPAAVVFAISTAVQSAIGQLPFLAGEALGLCACWAATRNRWTAAAALALGASLTSPLAGAFVVMAMAAWVLSRWAAIGGTSQMVKAAAMIAAGAAPIAASAVLFPGQGSMPYPVVDYGWEMAVAAGLWLIAGRQHRTVRGGVLAFAATATVAALVPSALGGNVGRLEDVLALPLAVGLLWPRRHLGRRVLLPLVAVPLVLSQWGPAWAAMTSDAGQASTHRAYFAPVISALARLAAGGPAGRIEVVPTKFHWEATYVAPVLPLARGWERQLDEADNPLFYGAASRLDGASYRAWLIDNGVRFVALADAPLDFAGRAEGRLVAAGVPDVRLVWRGAHWRVYEVAGSSGIVAAPARLMSQHGDRVVVWSPGAGTVLVRVRHNRNWRLESGGGCVAPAPPPPGGQGGGTWVRVDVPSAEQFSLELTLLPGGSRCPVGT